MVVDTAIYASLAFAGFVSEKWLPAVKSRVSPNHLGSGGLMDPIANMFSQIKNSVNANKQELSVSYSKAKTAILENLKKTGFIADYKIVKNEQQKYPSEINIKLKYENRRSALNDIKRVSKPGKRVYAKAGQLSKLLYGKADIILSTSKGVMSLREARKQGLGGEVICEVR